MADQQQMSRENDVRRRLPVGAEAQPGGVHFRVWAPRPARVAVVTDGAELLLAREPDGYWSTLAAGLGAGARYRYRLDGGDYLYPDPASRYQPEGPHGPSEVVDPGTFRWTDPGWPGVQLANQVLYELHVGTFTSEGTYAAATAQLPALAELGVTVIELMPLHEFPGKFGWGYDGVDLYAPYHGYGTPDELRAFVDRAHALGVGVILDVVYNHLGPDGNYLKQFAPGYFSDRHTTDWGEAINFDGPDAGPVREFFSGNATYWIDEFRMDGLRFDATQNIYDDSADHILAAMGRQARAAAAERGILLVAENEPQHVDLVRPQAEGGYGLDALWNDDYHHSAMVAMTGRSEAYYSDYRGSPQEFISAIKYGYLYQGQRYRWQRARRGTPGFDVPPAAFIAFTQNHDQVANSARGQRAHELAARGVWRAMTALTLLGPGTPMLFQGQEFAASSPFHYFADHEPDLARLVGTGRLDFLSQFPSLALADVAACVPDPADPETFARCRLDHRERETHAEAYALHRDLLRLRRAEPAFRAQQPHGVDGAVLGPAAFVLRFFAPGGDRLLLVNLGADLHLTPAPEPLLAPAAAMGWGLQWSSEDPCYGGGGSPEPEADDGWHIQGQAALVLRPAAGGRPVRPDHQLGPDEKETP